MRLCRFASVAFSVLLISTVHAADYRVEPLNEAPPEDVLEQAIHEQLSTSGARVLRGSQTTFCDIWLCKNLPARPGFDPNSGVMYPFAPGQLIGVIRYSRDASDFRDQEIEKGVYTLRFGLQPIDGSHVGTSPTRDFLLLVAADQDRQVDPLEYDELVLVSSDAAGSNHPCLLSLQKPTRIPATQPLIRHDENRDWWMVTLRGVSGEKPLPIELVVVGQGSE